MIAAVCEHFGIGPTAVREATWEEFGALVRRMNDTNRRLSEASRGG